MSELCPRWPAEGTYRWLAADRLIAGDSGNEDEEEEEEERAPDEQQDDEEEEDIEDEYNGYSG